MPARMKTGLAMLLVCGYFPFAVAETRAQTNPSSLTGITLDDSEAAFVGDWSSSTSIRPYLGQSYRHDGAEGKGEKSATFTFRVPVAGSYHVLLAYTAQGNRDAQVPVKVSSTDGVRQVSVDQTKPPELATGFVSLGEFSFSDTSDGQVEIATGGTRGHVIVDGIRLLTAAEYAAALKQERGKQVAQKTAAEKKKPAKPKPQPPVFERRPPAGQFTAITAEQLDALLLGSEASAVEPIDDIQFLRRVTLDLIGRQPSLEEYHQFLKDDSAKRRETLVERLLNSPAFGKNWANYWSDVIAARQEEPQLTYLNYAPFRSWLAEQFNRGAGWDETVFRMLTAIGTVGDGPEGTFVGFHQGERNKLAGESARIFLGLKIGCAQCHDHPFVDMPQETFHGMAAFFARTQVKLPWNDSDGIEISSAEKGEHKMPGASAEIAPTMYRGEALELGVPDLSRRSELAYWLVAGDNPYFARAAVNHVVARLLGRGFFDPVDDLGEGATALNPQAHDALAAHFIAAEFDQKALFRLLVATRAYSQSRQDPGALSGAKPKKLRGDEVFDSLTAAIDLPNQETKVEASTTETRFPPPPKTTRDLVNDVFGFDPSTPDQLVTRTMKQAIFMMNNVQLHHQIDASPGADTMLSRLLKREADDGMVVEVLYARVLARQPSAKERQLVLGHVASVGDRGAGFEDVLWSLLNSAEFTTRD